MITQFDGTGVALVTPFNDDLSIDFDSLERIINHTIAGGVDFLVALGTTGEPATLTKKEKTEIIEFCKDKIAGRVPLVVGAGGNNTVQLVKEIKELNKQGVAGLLSVAPYYNKPVQQGLYEHFKAVASASDLPVIIYNVPGRTGSNIAAETALRLANDCPTIVAAKEASGNFSQIMQILKEKPEGFNLLSGDDALTLPMISLGTTGVISVVANSHPREFSSLVHAAKENNFAEANVQQYNLLNYIDALFVEGSPSGIKASLEIMGLCKRHVRLPLAPASDELYIKLQGLLSKI
jgi:4-hydroxy-tetrahydrodipicolinate synthase